jgi:hypothetical protein
MTEVDLTPPTKGKKVAADPSAPKKPRAPRVNYGYAENAIITLTGKDAKYRGNRKEWFDSIAGYVGQSVKAWEASKNDAKDTPRGWLRFFVQDGTVSLVAAS